MGERIDLHDLNLNLAVLEERMKTMDERYDKGWALLREDIAKRDQTQGRDLALLREEFVKRETRLLLAVAGLISFGVVIFGILIRWPG